MHLKHQRIRDPLHNLIEFNADVFEGAMWQVIQTPQFQRLRRIKQLGFSEFVYPGATHTRFAHSVGAFHTARKLMFIIEDRLGKEFNSQKANVSLAAALVHDVGHGPFSHAFEDVGKRLKLKLGGHHEEVSDLIIRDSEVSAALNKEYGNGFASDVADVIKSAGPRSIYAAVVSSQFDADRLDYMQRDRLMTGTHHGAIDFNWLLSNLEVGKVMLSVDEESLGEIETFVLGPKASYAAETYLLSLFQLYPTVYFHKATRGAEKLFTELLVRTIELARNGSHALAGLPPNHPLVQFSKNTESIKEILALDDTVIWGSISMMAGAKDTLIREFATRLRDRKLFKCIDVREQLSHRLGKDAKSNLLDDACASIGRELQAWEKKQNPECPQILIDDATRIPYRKFQESKGPLNQIMIKTSNGALIDVAQTSKLVVASEPFKLFRVYISRGNVVAENFIKKAIDRGIRHAEKIKKQA
jgi:uncharacterized protein